MQIGRPVWAEVSRSRLVENYRAVAQRAQGAAVCAVVKCDAYGHGAVECARTLIEGGAEWLAVTSPEEGVELRETGMAARILLLSGFWRDEATSVTEHRLTPSVWEEEHLEYLRRQLPQGARFPVHVEIDTGMSRQGVPVASARGFLANALRDDKLAVEGISQHYAAGEDCGPEPRVQEEAFVRALSEARAAGAQPRYWHVCNSGATVARRPLPEAIRSETRGLEELVRAGIALYGYELPLVGGGDRQGCGVRPVLEWKTRIVSLREVEAGARIGYSGAYVAQRRTRVASLAVGYGDGLNRLLSSRGRVLVRGAVAPIVGNVSMDMTLADVTDVPGAEIGDEVVLIGTQGSHAIDAWEHAHVCGTIPYEVLCRIGPRVPRVYVA